MVGQSLQVFPSNCYIGIQKSETETQRETINPPKKKEKEKKRKKN